MSRRLRGLAEAYRAGRLDEFIVARFGSFARYMKYVLKRERYSYYRGIPVVKTSELTKEESTCPLVI